MDKNKKIGSGEMSTSAIETHLQPLSDNRHPLLNDVVLTELFEFFPSSDLPRFRLVSKKWRAVASDRFRRDIPAVFECPWSISGTLRLESFFELMRNLDPEEVPFGYFRMKSMDMGQLPVESEMPISIQFLTFRQNIEQFWGRYGSCISKLELCNSIVHSVGAFKKLILEETPNLEELSLVDIYDKSGSPSHPGTDGGNIRMQPNFKHLVVNPSCCLPVSWDLLSHFPNIQNVDVTPNRLDNVWMDNGRIAEHLTKISEQLNNRPRPCRITVDELKFYLRSEQDATLSKTILQIPQLFLPKFRFIVEFNDREDCEMDLLSTAFRHHGKNLEGLYVDSFLRRLPYRHFPFIKHGPFNSTTEIALKGNLCENLHFLQHFPNLKFLEMSNFGRELLEGTESAIMETFTLDYLRELRLDMNDGISEDKMEMLVKMMPKVKTFVGRLLNPSLRVLCREWRQLRVLRIGTSTESRLRINDEGITGIILGREERFPNITDLKDLEHLSTVHVPRPFQVTGLSDDAIWNGFLQMPNLKNLYTKISPEASEDAFQALREKFPNCNITRYELSSLTWTALDPTILRV